MKPLNLAMVALVALALGSSGCLHSNVDAHWGEAQEGQIAAQTADPTAPHSATSPEGLDAVSSERVAERYYKAQSVSDQRKAKGVVIGEIE
jgi:hypothetical protein